MKDTLSVTAIHPVKIGKRLEFPLFLSKVTAGFPSPADDFMEKKIDLNEHCIRHPAATFFVRVTGQSMKGVGINTGDILVVDRSLTVKDKSVVLAVLNGEFTVKHVEKQGKRLFLLPANPLFQPIEVTEEMDFEVWGVVTKVIHDLPC